MLFRCKIFGHDWRRVDNPTPRRYKPDGRPILRMPASECRRCRLLRLP